MCVAGVDIGSSTSKAVILNSNERPDHYIIQTGPDSRESGERVMKCLLSKCGLRMDNLKMVVATGYGRANVPYADEVKSEIACHAKGAHFLFPTARTILDVGGQDCKAIRINELGEHVNFVMNDKCAAGTGRFLEVMAALLKVPLDEIGELSLKASQDTKISNVCAVFAKSEVLWHMRRGIQKANILGGLHAAQVESLYGLIKHVGIEADFVFSGGVAKNPGIVKRLQAKLGLPALIAEEPRIIGALGAAIFAKAL